MNEPVHARGGESRSQGLADNAPPIVIALAGTKVDARVLRAIRSASQTTGVALPYLLAKAYRESRFDVSADASASSAAGIFQFTRQTWLDLFRRYGAVYGYADLVPFIRRTSTGYLKIPKSSDGQFILNLRHDPVLSSQLAAEYTRENNVMLLRSLKRPVTPEELYIAHFMGAQGAIQLLTAAELRPNVSAAKLFPEAAASNRRLFYSDPHHKEISVSSLRRRLVRSFRRELQRFSGSATGFDSTIIPRMARLNPSFTLNPLASVPRKPQEAIDYGTQVCTKTNVTKDLEKIRSLHSGLALNWDQHKNIVGRVQVMGDGVLDDLATIVVLRALAATKRPKNWYPDTPSLTVAGWREKKPTFPKIIESLPKPMARAALVHARKAFVRVSSDRVTGNVPQPQTRMKRVVGGPMPIFEESTDLKSVVVNDKTAATWQRPDV